MEIPTEAGRFHEVSRKIIELKGELPSTPSWSADDGHVALESSALRLRHRVLTTELGSGAYAAKHGETSVDVNLSIGAKEQVLVQNSNNSKIINKNKNINQVIKCSF